MLNFQITPTGVVLEYTWDENLGANTEWVWNELTTNNNVKISQLFLFEIRGLLNPPASTQDFDGYHYQFQFGSLDEDYVNIPGRILDS